jgi:hypothetical protein
MLLTPLPDSSTDVGEFEPEWVMAKVADFDPVLVGANVTFTVVD